MLNPEQKTHWFIIYNNDSILLTINNILPEDKEITSLSPYFLRHFKLGDFQGEAYCCAEITHQIPLNDLLYPVPLRKALSLFPEYKYGLGVKAYSVVQWDKNHQFCGRCGSATVPQDQGFERLCRSCALRFFPRISPSIIVLIRKGDHLLMARSPHFLPGVYGLIAGFVEVGENLEEAVHREVKEEIGLQIKNLAYFGSQPWPFPDSLMIGFTADYAAGDIVIDPTEIEAAGWYKYDDLPGRPSTSISISSILIDSFIKERGIKNTPS